jgi:hypothetical protein
MESHVAHFGGRRQLIRSDMVVRHDSFALAAIVSIGEPSCGADPL